MKKKITLLLCTFLLALTGVFFVGCGKVDESKTSLTCSSSPVTLNVGGETTITFTIENFADGMDGELNITYPNFIELTQTAPRNGQTLVTIKGVKPGLNGTIIATTKAEKTCMVPISVLKTSETIENNNDNLFVTQQSPFVPSAASFVLDEGTNVTDLEYHFYGFHSVEDEEITFDDVSSRNRFESVSLEGKYLIFKNGDDLYTLKKPQKPIDGYENISIEFMEVEKDENGGYNFGNALAVGLAQKFTFVAFYGYNSDGDDNKPIAVAREFTVLDALIDGELSFEYESGPDYTEDNKLLFVPNYEENISCNSIALTLDIGSSNKLISEPKITFGNPSAFSWKRTYAENGVYTYLITNLAQSSFESYVEFNYYYLGYEAESDNNVNHVQRVDISVVYKPEGMLVNKYTEGQHKYNFYNTVYNEGWQDLNLELTPSGSGYDSLTVEFDENKVKLRYFNGQTYVDVKNEEPIKDFNIENKLQAKGASGGEAGDGIIEFVLGYDILGNGDVRYKLGYTLSAGANAVFYQNTKHQVDGISVAYDPNTKYKIDKAIFVNSTFNSAVVTHASGNDVASVTCAPSEDSQEGDKYPLVLTIATLKTGSGEYKITLDNGYSIIVKINVEKSIDSFSIEYNSSNGAIASSENTYNKIEDDTLTYETNLYILNNVSKNAEFTLVANGDVNAGIDFKVSLAKEGNNFTYDSSNMPKFTIRNVADGEGKLVLKIEFLRVSDEYTRENVDITYNVNIITYSYIDKLNVLKTKDGKGQYGEGVIASYVNIYTGANNVDARTVQLKLTTNKSGFGFYDPNKDQNGNIIRHHDTFDPKFVYFSVPGEVEKMCYVEGGNNIYTIGNFGTFDTSTLTFTANSSTTFNEFVMIAHVRQYGRSYQFEITFNGEPYVRVSELTLEKRVEEMIFSANKESTKKQSLLVLDATAGAATNSSLKVFFRPDEVDGQLVNIFGENNEGVIYTPLEDGKTFLISLDCSKFVGTPLSFSNEELKGTLEIAATDWLLGEETIDPIFNDKVIRITIRYANGTESNPFALIEAEDVISIKNAPGAHYVINTQIDMKGHEDKLPLGAFSGSIIGKNDYAKIYNINVNKGSDAHYGLFTSIEEGGLIKNVNFEGSINVTNAEDNAKIGLLAGENKGTLSNIGVKITSHSSVSVGSGASVSVGSGASVSVGGVVGENHGTISQDYTQFEVGGEFAGQVPNLLLNMKGASLVVTYQASSARVETPTIKAGGVTGYNKGTIEKTDATNLTLYGYLNYLAYANVEVKCGDSAITDGKQGTTSYVGGVIGYNDGGYLLGTLANDEQYVAGTGIVVGGTIIGPNYVGGVVGYINGNATVDGVQYIDNITTRAFVRGTGANVGLVVGEAIATTAPACFVQAVDEGGQAIEAAMFIRYLTKETQTYIGADDGKTNLNKLAYGGTCGLKVDEITSYLQRPLVKITDANASLDTSNKSYYGDYVEINGVLDTNTKQKDVKGIEFDKDTNVWTITPNDKFAKFESKDIFYVYYFKAALTQNDSFDEGRQAALDERFNTLNSSSDLYPFKADSGLMFKSSNPSVIDIDEYGQITVKRLGMVEITISSILNTNDSKRFYLKSVGYFNGDENLSIVYPQPAATTQPYDEDSKIEIRGTSVGQVYVVPNYKYNNTITDGGLARFENVTVQLDSCNDIKVEAAVIDGGAMPDDIDSMAISVNNQTYFTITNNGQSLTIKRNANPESGTYYLHIRTYIEASLGEGKNYKAYVNKDIIGTRLIYTKGAELIATDSFEMPVYSHIESEQKIYITSQSDNEELEYRILRDGEIVQGDYLNDESYPENDGLFHIDFVPNGVNDNGEQVFILKVTINKNSDAYKDRYINSIYGDYTILVYAQSNHSVFARVILKVNEIGLQAITEDTYSSIAEIDNATRSSTVVPGKRGLMILNMNPIDADFDRLEIYSEDAGNLSLSLMAKKKDSNGQSGADQYEAKVIQGAVSTNRLSISLQDILSVYNNNAAYVNYNGVIYISYLVTNPAFKDGQTYNIKIDAYRNGKLLPCSKTVSLKVQLPYFIQGELVGGNEIKLEEEGIDNAYQVARGLSYKLNLSYYGFAYEDITVTSNIPTVAKPEKIGGEYYIKVMPNPLNYKDKPNGYPVELTISATRLDEGVPTTETWTTRLYVLEWLMKQNGSKDIVTDMDGGMINIQVGSRRTLGFDLSSIVEYDQTSDQSELIRQRINIFSEQLAKAATWNAYTNVNQIGQANGRPAYEGNCETEYDLLVDSPIENMYFKSQGLTVTPMMTHKGASSYYSFSVKVGYKVDSGVYVPTLITEQTEVLSTTFTFNVFQFSSLDHPIPISTYEELMDIENQKGGNYILMADITLPTDFKPLTSQIASFDGNGKTISFAGEYNFGEKGGLFASLSDGAVVKNVTIKLNGNVNFIMDADDFRVGLIAGENNGNITNCYVHSSATTSTTLTAIGRNYTSASYIAGIAGENSGNITNSRVSISMTSSYNMAGIAGTNSGIIASSYFKEGRIVSQSSQPQHHVGGLVVENRQNGKIITSYVSGAQSDNKVYCDDTVNYYIKGSSIAGGFAYENQGMIEDCYSNIYTRSGESSAGFAYANGGTIRNCFSLSVLENKLDSSAGFSYLDVDQDGNKGSFANCYYLKDSNAKINTSIRTLSIPSLEPAEFGQADIGNFNNRFDEYSYTNKETSGVWYYEGNMGRLELVAPNVIASSVRTLKDTQIDESTGQSTYYYEYEGASIGESENPYLVSSATELEQFMLAPMTKSGLNNKHYRLIGNIEYEVGELSELYQITFFGSIEGNGMRIRNMTSSSSAALENGGMFAQIGRDSINRGVVTNLTLEPRRVSFANTACVGALAGTLTYSDIYNVDIYTENDAVVLGQNMVGGLVGKLEGTYSIGNVSSNVSAVAYYIPPDTGIENGQDKNSYGESGNSNHIYSYAGGLVGYADGTGTVKFAQISNVSDVMGDRIGIAAGGVGTNSTFDYIYVTPSDDTNLKAYSYAGLAFGEIKGNVKHVSVLGSDTDRNIFSLVPQTPKAVGGLAGLMFGGNVSDCYVSQSLNIEAIVSGESEISGINNVGGLVGIVRSADAHIDRVIVNVPIAAKAVKSLGGIIGEASSNVTINDVAVKSEDLSIKGRISNVMLGGFIGTLSNPTSSIKNSYSHANLKVDTHVTGSNITSNVGSFVGSGIPAVMQYCYSTGSINVTMEDYKSNASKTNYGNAESGLELTSQMKDFSSVWFFGYRTGDIERGNYEGSTAMLKYEGKKDTRNVSLVKNDLGYGSRIWLGATSEQLKKDVLKGIFVEAKQLNQGLAFQTIPTNTEKWTIGTDGFSVLKMEDDFTWLR